MWSKNNAEMCRGERAQEEADVVRRDMGNRTAVELRGGIGTYKSCRCRSQKEVGGAQIRRG